MDKAVREAHPAAGCNHRANAGQRQKIFLEDEWGFRGEELRVLPKFHYIARRKAGAEERGVITALR